MAQASLPAIVTSLRTKSDGWLRGMTTGSSATGVAASALRRSADEAAIVDLPKRPVRDRRPDAVQP